MDNASMARRAVTGALALALPLIAPALAAPKAATHHSPARTSAVHVTFDAAVGPQPAGPYGTQPFSAVLPSGRVVTPAGTSVVVGMNALHAALAPGGRYAIVTCDDEREGAVRSALDPRILGGYALAVVDVERMQVVEQYRPADATFFQGVVALDDPSRPGRTLVLASGGGSNVVYALTLDANGHLTPDARPTIPLAPPVDPSFGNNGRAFPATLVASASGRRVYVVNELGDSVAAIDTATRTVLPATAPVGYYPLGAALAGDRLLVVNEGLDRYRVLGAPATAPPFRVVPSDLSRASSLSFVPLGTDGAVSTAAADAAPLGPSALPMDPAPDALRNVGGAHPAAIAVSPRGDYAYIAMANVDRIATVSLGPSARVVGGTELRLFDGAPYGTQPSDLALSRDGTRLYVALAGLDAIAVIDARDPRRLHRVGLIPTGWYPTSVTLGDGDRVLYVCNAKGFGHDRGFTGDSATRADSNAVWSTFEKIDLASVRLAQSTPATLADTRRTALVRRDPIVPQSLAQGPSSAIKHVVFILEENKTYDSMLGDLTDARGLAYGPGDPAFVAYGQDVTPNLHALARTFGLAGNLFADAEESDMGHQFAAGGIASLYGERTELIKAKRRPLANKNEDPEDYPRAGYIFNSLARAGKTFRDYGDLIRVSGYDEGEAPDPKTDDPGFAGADDVQSPTQGLGGLYSLDVPAPAVLAGHVDLTYPGWNLRIRDERRAREFLRDFGALARAGRVPAYTYIWLPADHGGRGPNIPPLSEEVADGDRALGEIVQSLTHLPTWPSTAIFVTPDDAQSTRDHIDEYRTYAVVISPYAKRHYLGREHLSTVSILKTTEEILGLPPLALGDLLATDMSDFFTPRADRTPYAALPVATQTGTPPGDRIADLLQTTDQSSADADTGRGGSIADLARRADLLYAHRSAYAPARYAALQGALFEAAVEAARR